MEIIPDDFFGTPHTGTVVAESFIGTLLDPEIVPVLVDGYPGGDHAIRGVYHNPCCFRPIELRLLPRADSPVITIPTQTREDPIV